MAGERLSVRCTVQCVKCGWRSTRHISLIGKSVDQLGGIQSYNHLKCKGRVLVKGIQGFRVLQ